MNGAWNSLMIPVAEIPRDEQECDENPSIPCCSCATVLTEWAYFTSWESDYYCEPCIQVYCEQVEREAREYAQRECKITRQFPQYDELLADRPTLDDFAGRRAYFAHCRHECTNYDKLIQGSKDAGFEGKISYEAIRERIHELIDGNTDDDGDDETAHDI